MPHMTDGSLETAPHEETARPRTSGPEIVAPTNRVNVALPFSKIQIHEPSEQLRELLAIVSELVALTEKAAPSPQIHALRRRTRALAERMG